MRQIKASEFKAKCLKLIDDVNQTGEAIVITKHGKPVARLEREQVTPRTLRGSMKGDIEILTPDGLLPSAWDTAAQNAVEQKMNRLAKDTLPPRRKSKRA